jgi:hypothetical protein
MTDVETTAPSPASSSPRNTAWIWGVATFVIVFGIVCYMGEDRIQSNPKDVIGTATLFAVLAALLGARIGWRLANRK